jgi:hypothetical protein
MVDVDPHLPDLEDIQVSWLVEPEEADDVECHFYYQDEDNSYFVKVDYSGGLLDVWSRVATVNTKISGTISVPYLKKGVQDGLRVVVVEHPAGFQFQVYLNGELEIEDVEAGPAWTGGHVGVVSTGGNTKVKMVEVTEVPFDKVRVGPNP